MTNKFILFLRSTANLAVPAAGDPDGTVRVNVVAGGVGGGIMTVADGGDVAQGTTTDAEAAAGNGTIIALLKRIRTLLAGPFYPPTQPVSAADGQIQTIGFLADAVVATDAAGSLSGKMRGLVKWCAERMPAVIGQLTKAESLAVTLASDEDNVNVDVVTLPAQLQGPATLVVDSYSSAVVNLAASGADQELVAIPGAGKQIWVYGLFMMADTAAGTVTLQDEDNTPLSGTMAVSDEGGWVLPMSGNFAMPWIKVATNKALEADTGACTVDGIITYSIVSV